MGYEAERGLPSTQQCLAGDSPVTLLFDGYYLKLLIDGEVDAAWHARSGQPQGDWFNYTVEQQKKSDVGPVPNGNYWILPNQISSIAWNEDSWGPFRVTIHYFPTTQTYSRGGFFIHGGKTFGSKGCIDLAPYMRSFVEKMRSLFFGEEIPDPEGGGLIQGYSSCHIPLTVKYAKDYVQMP